MKNKNDYKFIFLTCGARGGASLLSSILNANSKISFSADKIKFFTFVKERYPTVNNSNVEFLLREMKLRLDIRFDISLDIDMCRLLIGSDFTYNNLYKAFMISTYKMDKNSDFLGECENMSWENVPFFLKEIKNSIAFSIIRDPRDVLYSFKKNTIAKGNDYLVNIFNTKGLMQTSIKYHKKYKNKFHIVKFENLKKNDVREIKKICDFIGVNFEEKMLDEEYWTELGAKGWKKWRNKKVSSFYNKKSHDNPVRRWKDNIDPVDHFIVEWLLKKEMREFDYKPEFSCPNNNIFKEALNRLTSSKILCEMFYSCLINDNGNTSLPLDKYNPYFWDTKYINNNNKLEELAILMGYK